MCQNYDDVFVKQKAIINKLFNEDELKRIAQFRKNVMPTLWADIKINPYDNLPIHRKLIDKKNSKVEIFDLGNHILIIGMILLVVFVSINVD